MRQNLAPPWQITAWNILTENKFWRKQHLGEMRRLGEKQRFNENNFPT